MERQQGSNEDDRHGRDGERTIRAEKEQQCFPHGFLSRHQLDPGLSSPVPRMW